MQWDPGTVSGGRSGEAGYFTRVTRCANLSATGHSIACSVAQALVKGFVLYAEWTGIMAGLRGCSRLLDSKPPKQVGARLGMNGATGLSAITPWRDFVEMAPRQPTGGRHHVTWHPGPDVVIEHGRGLKPMYRLPLLKAATHHHYV